MNLSKVFRSHALVLVAFVLAACSKSESPERMQLDPTLDVLITNVTVIDAPSGVRERQNVGLSGERITFVESANGAPNRKSRLVIDGSDKFLIPGLWDMHVHFTYAPELGEAMLDMFLSHGITSVRDTGGPLEAVVGYKKLATERGGNAPRVMIAGPLLDGADVVYDGSSPGSPEIGVAVVSEAAAVAAVQSLVNADVDLIKVYEMLSEPVYRRLLKEAATHGLPVTGHIPLSMSAEDALQAGLSSVEHMRNFDLACAEDHAELLAMRQAALANPDNLSGAALRSSIHTAQRDPAVARTDDEVCAKLVQTIIDARVAQVPTMALVDAVYRRSYTNSDWQQSFDDLPSAARDQWLANAERYSASADQSPESAMSRAAYVAWFEGLVNKIDAAGGTILAGTDTPIFFMTPGASLHRELQRLVAAGMDTERVLAAATYGAAQYFGLQDTLGHISAGAQADLILLNASPVANIANTTQIETVVRAGTVHDSDAIEALRQRVRNSTARVFIAVE